MYTPAPRIEWPVRADLFECLRRAGLIAAAFLLLLLPYEPPKPSSQSLIAVEVQAGAKLADFKGENASAEARQVANWVTRSGDNLARSFVILDKREARVFLFDARGSLIGATPVLLGAAAGDESVAGIGKRPIAEVRPEERTTPAGRFIAEAGRNALGEDVLWVDYEAAVSMHRVRVVDPRERRLERLASPSAADKRISYGCVNVPVSFFENVLLPHFKGRQLIVYVLPEVKTLHSAFPGFL